MGIEPGTDAKRWSRQLGRLAPLPLGQGHSKRKGPTLRRCPSRTLKAHRSAAFAHGCHRGHRRGTVRSMVAVVRLALPFPGCGGRNRTCDVTLNRRPPVPTQAPPQSKSGRRDLNPGHHAQRGPVLPRPCCARCPAEYQAFLRPALKDAQRESNPHFRHGKAAGCRRPTFGRCPHGRKRGVPNCQTTGAPDQRFASVPGLEPSSPHYGCGILATTNASRRCPDQCSLQWDQRDLNPGHRRSMVGRIKNPLCCR